MSRRELARLDGCSEKLVRKAIAEGRIPVGEDGLVDAAIAGTAWREGNVRKALLRCEEGANPSAAARAIADAAAAHRAVPPYADSLARKEHFLSLLRELEFRQRDGQLVEMEVAKAILFTEFRALRDSWLAFPAKYAAMIAADLSIDADKLTEVLSGYIHKHTAALAQPSARAFVEA
ncbi:MAG: hypothetical protein KGI90_07040 [Burkholderiales bacterium]|nr:hypothetical protein [Burkholderiales bacterium]